MAEMEDPKSADSPSKTVTRRRFILGVIAGGAVVGAASYRFLTPSAHGRGGSGAGDRLITLNVNGKPRRVDVMKQETLAFTLRYKLGLTGTKLGCDRAECGACTVLLDDVPHYSCSVLTHTVRGRSVTTIEGLAAADGTLHPVQQAVIDQQGFQCAFCMSGFLMSAVGFLKTNPNPTRLELAHGISGNLCRCQDYNKILDSMMRGAEYMRTGVPSGDRSAQNAALAVLNGNGHSPAVPTRRA
jgi:aerobic-type carbon monoxide dehydrogenase small subunit (CoxS/CutS family)